MIRFAVLAAASALLLAGCQTIPTSPNDYPPAAPPRQAAMRPGPPPPLRGPAPNPGVPGPVASIAAGQVGHYMDGEERDLRRTLRGQPVMVRRMGNDIALNLRSDMLFGSGSSRLSPDAMDTIDAIAGVLRRYDKTMLEVNGYTDTTGTAQYNQKLSRRRAEAVADVLVNDGINPARISPRGYGERHLLIPTGNNVSEPHNRRVEIRILPHARRG